MKKKWLAGLLVALSFSAPIAARADTVNVMYAGSLVHLMEQRIGPAFEKATGTTFRGYAGGSNKLANEIKGKLRRADVFISANPAVNKTLMGESNGDWVGWYANFAESPLLIGYNPRSRFAKTLQTERWDRALTTPGIRIGRTDPKLDPKGAYTMQLLEEAERVYQAPGLSQRMLGAPDNPQQVLPEETLVGRLQSGQLDAGFFYSTETSDLNIPAIRLPADFDIKARYTVTVVNRAPNAEGAARFVNFLLSDAGRKLLRDSGVDVLPTPVVTGDAGAVPPALQVALPAPRAQ
ncbi:extracellular solute-binding protein [Chitinasiproducens palmae]|uniref:Molybdate/tungstate transport system substrate-binding protein n=1 Tax=Chitinasiproducens palmae TaxID=1770053 RepID=A0A1H2PJV8_9BURK|nr:extracellular solute-binding protein [Chitinasiproducens palmae]SDV46654.1 molybdate/tungstate transport system substrate-binding protein [Chitinasiproducens palmae]